MRLSVVVALACLSASITYAQEPIPPATPWIEIPLPDGVFREHDGEYRTDTIDIPLEAFGELEYKLAMSKGDSIVYRWNVVDMANPERLYAEFHGHTERVGGAPGSLMFYRKASGGSERGALVAPFSGIHGWYLKNDTDQAIVVRLDVAGFYELLEP
jgi:hypothetical protein